jgi:hypothetical protein
MVATEVRDVGRTARETGIQGFHLNDSLANASAQCLTTDPGGKLSRPTVTTPPVGPEEDLEAAHVKIPGDIDGGKSSIGTHAFQLLYDNIHDFKTTAMHVDLEVKRHGIRSDSGDTVPDMQGRQHRDMWVSMKTVSHYNLGMALELMLKLILRLNQMDGRGHHLAKLYDKIPREYQGQLESAFRLPAGGLKLIAFANSANSTTRPSPPPNRDISSLRGFFEYFDEDLRWWEKRYSWESVQAGRWRHYLSDISPFVELINRVMGRIERPSSA